MRQIANSPRKIHSDMLADFDPAAVAFPILSLHWPRFDEEYAASAVKNALPEQRDQAPCAFTMISN